MMNISSLVSGWELQTLLIPRMTTDMVKSSRNSLHPIKRPKLYYCLLKQPSPYSDHQQQLFSTFSTFSTITAQDNQFDYELVAKSMHPDKQDILHWDRSQHHIQLQSESTYVTSFPIFSHPLRSSSIVTTLKGSVDVKLEQPHKTHLYFCDAHLLIKQDHVD